MSISLDIRKEGSGNAGATNVLRVLGKGAACFVLAADFLKGLLPVLLAPVLADRLMSQGSSSPEEVLLIRILTMLMILIGHAFPLWAGFRGGKGVASSAGGVAVLYPPAVPFCLAVFVITVAVSRYVSLGSLVTAWFLPLLYMLTHLAGFTAFSLPLLLSFLAAAALITVLHRNNIKRLLRGEEKKVGSTSSS